MAVRSVAVLCPLFVKSMPVCTPTGVCRVAERPPLSSGLFIESPTKASYAVAIIKTNCLRPFAFIGGALLRWWFGLELFAVGGRRLSALAFCSVPAPWFAPQFFFIKGCVPFKPLARVHSVASLPFFCTRRLGLFSALAPLVHYWFPPGFFFPQI